MDRRAAGKLTRSTVTRKELRIAVVEIQLEMLCIEAKLTKASTNLPSGRVVGGGSRPPLIPALVNELKKTAICEEQRGLRELRIRDVVRGALPGKIRECQGEMPSSSVRIDVQWLSGY